jgi:hypothetical protein
MDTCAWLPKSAIALVAVIAIGGCDRLSPTFERIKLGQPLDWTDVPQHVVVDEDPNGAWVRLFEGQQLLLPVGYVKRSLNVDLDANKMVTGLRLEEECISYWVVLESEGSETRRRFLVQDGERTSKERGHGLTVFIWDGAFVMGVGVCFGAGAKSFEERLSEASNHPPTDPRQAHVKNK